MVVSSSTLKEAQSEDWKLICICALSKLEDICCRVISGGVLVHELKTISDKESQMRKLCAAAAAPSEQKDNGKKSSQADIPPYDSLKMYLDMRQKELDYFMNYCKQLRNFLRICEPVSLSGNVLIFICFNDAWMVQLLCGRFPYLTHMPVQVCIYSILVIRTSEKVLCSCIV